ncbi:hypothetical protein SJAV_21310 [Sulfurisphaera javensis]|uniref:CARDB domain-containing protein n=2 Tax=Sulfurisphaera javensis TaxID=2049879 RepID=A0AAT9GTP1_9CREN
MLFLSAAGNNIVGSSQWQNQVVAPGMTLQPLTITLTNEGKLINETVCIRIILSGPFSGSFQPYYVTNWEPGQSIQITGFVNISPTARDGVYTIYALISPLYIYVPIQVYINGYVNLSINGVLSYNSIDFTLTNLGNAPTQIVEFHVYNSTFFSFPIGTVTIPSISSQQSYSFSLPVEVKAISSGVYYIEVSAYYLGLYHNFTVPILVSSNRSITSYIQPLYSDPKMTLQIVYSSPFKLNALAIQAILPQTLYNGSGGHELYSFTQIISQSGVVTFNFYVKGKEGIYTIPIVLTWYTNSGIVTQRENFTVSVYPQTEIELLGISTSLFAGENGEINLTVKNVGSSPIYNLTASEEGLSLISSSYVPVLYPGNEAVVTLTVYSPYNEEGEIVSINITLTYLNSLDEVLTLVYPEEVEILSPPPPIQLVDPGFQQQSLFAGFENSVIVSFNNTAGVPLYDVNVTVKPQIGSIVGNNYFYFTSWLPYHLLSITFEIFVPSSVGNSLTITYSFTYYVDGVEKSYSISYNYEVVSRSSLAGLFTVSISPSSVQYGKENNLTLSITYNAYYLFGYSPSKVTFVTVSISTPSSVSVTPTYFIVPSLSQFATYTKQLHVEIMPPSNGSVGTYTLDVTLTFIYDGVLLNYTYPITLFGVGEPFIEVEAPTYTIIKGNSSLVEASLSFDIFNNGLGEAEGVNIVFQTPPGISIISPAVIGVGDVGPSVTQGESVEIIGKPGNYTIPVTISYYKGNGQLVSYTYDFHVDLVAPQVTVTHHGFTLSMYDIIIAGLAIALIISIIWGIRRGKK